MGVGAQANKLPRTVRLQRSAEFAHLKARGRRAVRGCLIANWLPLPASSSSRVGVVVSRKVGSAVFRSRARRLLREAFRLSRAAFDRPVMLVLVARPSIVGKSCGDVRRDLMAALGQTPR